MLLIVVIVDNYDELILTESRQTIKRIVDKQYGIQTLPYCFEMVLGTVVCMGFLAFTW